MLIQNTQYHAKLKRSVSRITVNTKSLNHDIAHIEQKDMNNNQGVHTWQACVYPTLL